MALSERKTHLMQTAEGLEDAAGARLPYVAPCVSRVRVATARLTLGQMDANTFCTVHDHDSGFNPCTP
jgi:hypothetical protein